MKLHTKLLVSYLFVVLLPIIFIGYFLIHQTMNTVLKQTNYINQINFQQIVSNVSNQFDSYLRLSKNILSENQLLAYIQEEHRDSRYFEKYLAYDKINTDYLTKYPITTPEGDVTISIYSTNDTILHDNIFLIALDDKIKQEQWCQDIVDAHGDLVISTPYLNRERRLVISIGRVLNPYPFEENRKYMNILKMDVLEDNVYRLIEKEGINKQIFLLDQNNYIISATRRGLIGKKSEEITRILTDTVGQPGNSRRELDHNKKAMFVSNLTGPSPINEWKVVSIASSETMLKDINEIVKYSLIICIASAIIAIILVFVFSNTLTKKLRLLVRNMSKIREGRFEVFVDHDGTDEIGELSKSFKEMVERINALIADVYIAEMHVKDLDIKKKEAEINALQSQINPHFLFNTMESIRMNLLKKNDYETSDIIHKFSKLLRKNIDWKDDNITLQQEIEVVENYLEIQNYRYRDKFKYQVNIPSEFRQFIIPKFTLQPIVENAIYHGLEMKEGAGELQIFAQITARGLEVVVRDNGVGMDEKQLMKVREQIYGDHVPGSHARIGLFNVQQRLKLCCGNDYGISIDSTENTGTDVRILLPAIGRSAGR